MVHIQLYLFNTHIVLLDALREIWSAPLINLDSEDASNARWHRAQLQILN